MRVYLMMSMLLFGAHVHAMPIAPLGQQMEAQKASIVDEEGFSVPDALLDVNDTEEYDPYDADVQREVEESMPAFDVSTSCQGTDCTVYVHVSLDNQSLTYVVGGETYGPYPVSSGVEGRSTRRWNSHPDGKRIFTKYSSNKFPGGDYNGLGNMPYAMFYSGGFAIHGTPKANWKYLGTKKSHGCVRVHPDVAYQLNAFVRHFGANNTWFYIQ